MSHYCVMFDVTEERMRQEAKWPGASCAEAVWSDGFRLSVLVEEVGEVATEVCEAERDNENRDERLYAELIQVAAVAVAWAESIYHARGQS